MAMEEVDEAEEDEDGAGEEGGVDVDGGEGAGDEGGDDLTD